MYQKQVRIPLGPYTGLPDTYDSLPGVTRKSSLRPPRLCHPALAWGVHLHGLFSLLRKAGHERNPKKNGFPGWDVQVGRQG
eukprot:2956953-Rhodomonas_salina.4